MIIPGLITKIVKVLRTIENHLDYTIYEVLNDSIQPLSSRLDTLKENASATFAKILAIPPHTSSSRNNGCRIYPANMGS